MVLRWVTGLGAAAAMVLAAWGGGQPIYWLGFIVLLLGVAATEWAQLADVSIPIVLVTVLAGAAVTLLERWVLLPLVLFIPTVSVVFYQDPARGRDSIWSAAGVIWLSIPASLLYFVRSQYGFLAILVLMAGTIVQDSLALYTGHFFGGDRPFAPGLSPNKTWAGFVGGLMGMVFMMMVGGYYLGWPWFVNLAVGVILGLVGQAGDLSISALKRRMNVDDTGRIFPGHGGILDRCDALIFNVAVFYPVCRLVERLDLVS